MELKNKDRRGENSCPGHIAKKTLNDRKIQNQAFLHSPKLAAAARLQHRQDERWKRGRASTIARSKEAPSPTRLLVCRLETKGVNISIPNNKGRKGSMVWFFQHFLGSIYPPTKICITSSATWGFPSIVDQLAKSRSRTYTVSYSITTSGYVSDSIRPHRVGVIYLNRAKLSFVSMMLDRKN
jgi:hypothetical protein